MKVNRSELRDEARELRSRAKTFRQIAVELDIPLGTVHLWTRDVELSDIQKNEIRQSHIRKFVIGRTVKAHQKMREREREESEIVDLAKKQINTLQNDPIFLLGLGLYWAEGFKKDHSLGFVNSDVIMAKFFLVWLRKYCSVDSQAIRIRVQINSIYEPRIKLIEKYWSDRIGIPLSRFQKPYFLKSKTRVVLEDNHNGLIRIRAIGTRKQFVQILGWLEELRNDLEEK